MSLMNLIEKIKDFFLSLFASSSDDYKNQKALKSIMTELKKAKYPLYRSDNTVLAGLPIIIYELFCAILPLKLILASSIASNDKRISNSFLDALIEDKLSDEEKKMRESIRLENRIKDIPDLLDPDFDKKIKEQSSVFKDFCFALSANKFKNIDDIINKCFIFYDFATFKFNRFFAHFDSAFESVSDSDKIKEHYNFESVQGIKVLQDILDLDFLLQRICIDKNFIEGIFFFNSHLPEKLRRDESLIKRDMHNFSFIVENNLGSNSLKNLARLIKQDPMFEDKISSPKQYVAVEEYKNRITSIFHSNTRRLISMQQDQKLADLISQLFQNMEMLPLKFYNNELNKRIESLTVYSLDWVKPIEIIHTFTKKFFEPNFEPFLRELIVEGYFEDKKFQSDLAADYYFCESIPNRLREFENLTDQKKDYSEFQIMGFLARIENGGDADKPLSQSLDFLNLKAKELVEEISKKYSNLYKACCFIVDDAHQSIPNFVVNLKAMIISTRNKEKFIKMEEGMQKFSLFLDIIKKYVIIESVEIKNSIQD